VLSLVGISDTLHVLAELGVIFLLIQVGLETDIAELKSVGRVSMFWMRSALGIRDICHLRSETTVQTIPIICFLLSLVCWGCSFSTNQAERGSRILPW
jgi:Kef-type K+ transport system membrane component KefB